MLFSVSGLTPVLGKFRLQETKAVVLTPVALFAGLLLVTEGIPGCVGWMPVKVPSNTTSATFPNDPAGATYLTNSYAAVPAIVAVVYAPTAGAAVMV